MGKMIQRLSIWAFVGAFVLGACTLPTGSPANTATPFLPYADISPTQTETTIPSTDIHVWFDPGIPNELKSGFYLPFAFVLASSQADAQLSLLTGQESSVESLWIYALVAAFPTVQDDITWQDFENMWKGYQAAYSTFSKVVVSQATFSAMENILGVPGDGATEIVPEEEIVNRLWADRNSLAIVPFEDLQPRMKVLSIDSNSPIKKNFNQGSYPLVEIYGLSGDAALLDSIHARGAQVFPVSNRDPQKLTVVTMTGTTALVRAIAYKMETKGITYPGEKIKDVLGQGDFLDVSNEISFTPDCTYPNPNSSSLNFCSKPEYIQLLEDVGVNIVELTGNHLLDYNAQPFYETLDMYAQRGWGTFGGGKDAQSARQPLLIDHNGNRIAWIGCNVVGPEVDWATDYWPGSAKCDFAWMVSEIQQLKSEGYIVIATLQDQELYVPNPEPYIREHFLTLAAAGADIVQGSQAHFPQSFEFYQDGNTLIHYGLGNLFFDQMDVIAPGIQREFIDRYILYNGKYISTELITTMLEDFSQPRLMTQEERDAFLQEYFIDSGW
jgi:poly-gamma-glutamate synthesis protein (capsule biosynthesis protein)